MDSLDINGNKYVLIESDQIVVNRQTLIDAWLMVADWSDEQAQFNAFLRLLGLE